ncbi:uncharacterized protein C9orf85 homolog isoform X1 [Cricetulus griseus]|uniref:uncharacterized protein C9orf85 homolog isoform X1 n=1 Tax=Cricetulus griseus TaxID=10029 RepID=UPI0004547BF9|nr:uncharacterized protein C9orf85 homolog isoform X1 [Cricetulus griseus]
MCPSGSRPCSRKLKITTRMSLYSSSLCLCSYCFSKTPSPYKINAKVHDGVCQRCKEVLEWRVKYSKYKPLSKPKKCVKCLQKTVKDSYHIMCRPCACELEVCAKCGKKEDIIIPFNKEPETSVNTENQGSNRRRSCRGKEDSDEDLDAGTDSDDDNGDS